MTGPGVATAVVERILPATPDEVYDEWIDPDALLDWMCPRPARCLKVEADPRVGGRIRIDIEDNGQHFYVHGMYTDLDRPARLGFTWSCSTWPDPALVSHVLVTLMPHGAGQTLMTIYHSALTPDLFDQHLTGWRLIAAQLESVLASAGPRDSQGIPASRLTGTPASPAERAWAARERRPRPAAPGGDVPVQARS
ncbi:MAG: SRPBCC family protein [Sciscionella sp.]